VKQKKDNCLGKMVGNKHDLFYIIFAFKGTNLFPLRQESVCLPPLGWAWIKWIIANLLRRKYQVYYKNKKSIPNNKIGDANLFLNFRKNISRITY